MTCGVRHSLLLLYVSVVGSALFVPAGQLPRTQGSLYRSYRFDVGCLLGHLEGERFQKKRPVDGFSGISRPEHRNFPKGNFGALMEGAL